jgi:hypothetical protein
VGEQEGYHFTAEGMGRYRQGSSRVETLSSDCETWWAGMAISLVWRELRGLLSRARQAGYDWTKG